MKYKVKHEKSNAIFMISVIILSLVSCVFWLSLREYIYFMVFLILTLFIAYTYFETYYYLKKDYMLVKLGFINIKIKYTKLYGIENLKVGIKLKFRKFDMNIYPSNQDIFYSKLESYWKG